MIPEILKEEIAKELTLYILKDWQRMSNGELVDVNPKNWMLEKLSLLEQQVRAETLEPFLEMAKEKLVPNDLVTLGKMPDYQEPEIDDDEPIYYAEAYKFCFTDGYNQAIEDLRTKIKELN